MRLINSGIKKKCSIDLRVGVPYGPKSLDGGAIGPVAACEHLAERDGHGVRVDRTGGPAYGQIILCNTEAECAATKPLPH